MAKLDTNGCNQQVEKYVVRNVHITVEVKVSQRYLIEKGEQETLDDMFVRMREDSRSLAAKKDCETCRIIAKWAEECGGEVCDVVSTYNTNKNSFILDICIDFAKHEDSEMFCNELHERVNSRTIK